MPGRVFLSGALAGLAVALLGLAIGYLQAAGPWVAWVSVAGVHLAAGVAASVTASRLGGSPGSAAALGALALLLAFFLDSFLEYAMLLNFAMAPYAGVEDGPGQGDMDALLWRFALLLAFLNAFVGAVLGLIGRWRTAPWR